MNKLPDAPVKASIIAISRGGGPVEGPMTQVRVKAGDICVLEVEEGFFHENAQEIEVALIRRLTGARIKRHDHALYAILITIATVSVVAFGWMSMLNAALIASGLMILSGCMSLKDAGDSIDFTTLTIMASAIGLEAAVTGSGLSAKVADLLTRIGGDNPYIGLTVVFLGCIAMDTMITNVASAVFLFPIGMALFPIGMAFLILIVTLRATEIAHVLYY